MHRTHRYRIGLGYTLRVGDDVLNVTLIRKEGRHATVLIQDHSIRTSLIGYEGRKKCILKPSQHKRSVYRIYNLLSAPKRNVA